jgi:phosphate uptake regulator
MEIRKVQLTGGSSFVITLPKEWVTSLQIKKNDPVGLIAQPDGTLLVTSKPSGERAQRTKELDVDDIDDPVYLYRMLIGIYIMGFSTVVIRSKDRIAPNLRDSVIRFTQMTIGPEIMEEDFGSITIKDMLNPAEMPFEKTIGRMYILARTMHEDAMTSLKSSDAALADEVIARDSDVDRLHLLIARQSNILLRDVTLSKKMGVSMEDAIHYFLVSRILERVGDHAARIEESAISLIENGAVLDKKLMKKITDASSLALEILSVSSDAFMQRDIGMAHTNIENVSKLSPKCDAISGVSMDREADSLALSNIAESIRRTGEYAGDISELVINNLVQKE